MLHLDPPDKVLAYHEAGHAVIGTLLFPGHIIGAYLDVPKLLASGVKIPFVSADDDMLACVTYFDLPDKPSCFVSFVYAGKWAERKVNWDDPDTSLGDQQVIDLVGLAPLQKACASLRAKRLVHRHWESIDRIAHLLLEHRHLSGTTIASEIS